MPQRPLSPGLHSWPQSLTTSPTELQIGQHTMPPPPTPHHHINTMKPPGRTLARPALHRPLRPVPRFARLNPRHLFNFLERRPSRSTPRAFGDGGGGGGRGWWADRREHLLCEPNKGCTLHHSKAGPPRQLPPPRSR